MLTGHSLGGGVVNILALQVNTIRFNSIAFLSFLKEMLHTSCPLGQESSAFPSRHHRSSPLTTRSCWREPRRWSTSTSTTRILCPDSAWPSMRLAFRLYCYQCFYSVAQLLIAHHEVDALQLSPMTKVTSPSPPLLLPLIIIIITIIKTKVTFPKDSSTVPILTRWPCSETTKRRSLKKFHRLFKRQDRESLGGWRFDHCVSLTLILHEIVSSALWGKYFKNREMWGRGQVLQQIL